MLMLAAASVAFLLLHLVIAGTSLRGAVVSAIGEAAYLGLFSLASVGGIMWLAIAYGAARNAPGTPVYWDVTLATRHVQIALQLAAMLLITPGVLTPNPTSVRQEGVLDRPNAVQGMLRITRHPFLWGVALWAMGHILVNGDAASLTLFTTFLVLSVAGTFSIDAKRRKALGEAWAPFAAGTSNAPFGAMISGRQTLNIAEIGWWRLAAGVAAWAGLLIAHGMLFGRPALA